jgi:phosphoglycolate phosphatase
VKVILFDFDGTIVDSLEAGIVITNRLAAEFGFPPFDAETLEELKKLGSREALRRSRIPVWKQNQQIPTLNLFPEMQETLLELKREGHLLGIVSTNSIRNIQKFLRIQDLTSTFDFVCTSYAIFGKSRLIRRILQQQKLDPTQVYYVGDETRDIEAAHRSGIYAIAVTWGLNSVEILQANSPDFLINSPKELLPLILDKTESIL